MSGRYYLQLTIVIVLTLLMGACSSEGTVEPTQPPGDLQTEASPSEEPTEEESAEPVVLRVGGLMDADCFTGGFCTGPAIWGYLVEEGLTDHGPASEGCPGVPRVAESWEASNGGRTWTVRLHEGITYSDGTPLNAQTMKDYMEWMNASPDFDWNAETMNLETVEVLDELTFRYTTSVPVLNSPDSAWVYMYVLPPHIWGEMSGEEALFATVWPPIGTGPYTFTEYVPGSHMIFDAREDYYRGKPPIDRVIYIIYANMDALLGALIAGEIDLTFFNLPPESVDVLAEYPNITVEEKYPGDVYDLTFNVHPGGLRHPAIADPTVRMAIDYAIDKQKIVDIALLGHGIICPTNWGCGPNFEGEVNPDLVVTPYEPDRANQILDEAGYVDTDGDGIRETADGRPLEFGLVFMTEFPSEVSISQLVGEQLREIGIKVESEALDYATWLDVVTKERDYDMAIAWRTPDIDAAGMEFWFSCWAADWGFNYSGYCNEDFENLINEYRFSDDLDGRWVPMFEAQRIFNEDRPIIILAGPYQIQAYRNDRFEFPMDTCYVNLGMYDPQGLLNAVVK